MTNGKTYDWIVVGGGLTGAALSYELQKAGFRVLLLEKDPVIQGATRWSYGGIPYWAGTNDITHTLGSEGIARHRQLPDELEADTELRDLDLLLTIDPDDSSERAIAAYDRCAILPELLSVDAACDREPLLAPSGIAGALRFPHAHVNPMRLVDAYRRGFAKLGGEFQVVRICEVGDRGVKSDRESFDAARTAICAGGLTRSLLQASGISVRQYFTHAEVIETQPVDSPRLQVQIMPADARRFQLEADTSRPDLDELWDYPDKELLVSSVDTGAIQFRAGHLLLGQLSRIQTNPEAAIDAVAGERAIRDRVRRILPHLADLPGAWQRCLVAFSHDFLPLVGAVNEHDTLHLFSGFTFPFVYVPPLAARFAAHAMGNSDEIVAQLSPLRKIYSARR